MFEALKEKGFEFEFVSHAAAILAADFPEALKELEDALLDVDIPITEIIGSGGGEAKGTQRLRRSLAARHWVKVNFEIKKTINNVPRESISHEVDHVRTFEGNKLVALEIEWNNKDPFFDRDLENFKRLHAEGAISVGIIVTRGSTLQNQMQQLVARFTDERNIQSFEDLQALGLDPTRRQRAAVEKRIGREKDPMTFARAWGDNFVRDKFGAATTHWRKLMDRVDRGVGNPCPLVLVGLPASIVSFDPEAVIEMEPEGDIE
ncbi:restriction endonuclease [Burkholderia ubonensis]|uniref:BglII/BstYI family type II restriction endonuclease n=1 Tax=Burkholderia ubonensis TaxID=101571 RepID=UPI000758F196|nr:BglII/BstYI family type II restriction endonuclease [Burkholderia ubonensis]KVT76334.1 restriction endonuclease [Burkholderia ubonensis]